MYIHHFQGGFTFLCTLYIKSQKPVSSFLDACQSSMLAPRYFLERNGEEFNTVNQNYSGENNYLC